MTTPTPAAPVPSTQPSPGAPPRAPAAGAFRPAFRRPTGAGPRRADAGGPRRRDGRRYIPRRKVCHFCAEKAVVLDYKNVDVLRRFVSDRGRIEPRRKTGSCARHQRILVRQIKRARHLGLVPYTTDIARDAAPPR